MMRLGRRASLSPHTANNSGLLDAASRRLPREGQDPSFKSQIPGQVRACGTTNAVA
jgi:hypothetical protein